MRSTLPALDGRAPDGATSSRERRALPPLRERTEDILPIASRMLGVIAKRHGKDVRGFSREAVELLAAYAWPGNVRELQNEIERATALVTPGEAISSGHVSAKLRGDGRSASAWRTAAAAGTPAAAALAGIAATTAAVPIVFGETLPRSLRDARDLFESMFIARAIELCEGNVTRAAQEMGISRSSIHSKLRDGKGR